MEAGILSSSSISRNARLYANRFDMLKELGTKYRHRIFTGAEIGVGLGKFSPMIINEFQLDKFTAFDTFDLHLLDEVWGQDSDNVFKGRNHLEFYTLLMSPNRCKIDFIEGDSLETLAKQPECAFDFIYVDGDHSFEAAKHDGEQAVRMIKNNGLIIFNDYTLFDHQKNDYGVIQAVNQILSMDKRIEVVGFALHPRMYCDIAVRVNKNVLPIKSAVKRLYKKYSGK